MLRKSQNDFSDKDSDVFYLEVSGIWKETKSNTINMRLNLKKRQVEKTVGDAPAFVVVTEFGTPKAKISKQ